MRRALLLVLLLTLAGCGAAPAAQPTAQAAAQATPRATRQLPTPRPRLTATPEPPTAPPATRGFISDPAPTAVPITASTTQAASLYPYPDEGYVPAAELAAGEAVTVRYRGGLWLQVATAAGVEGWLYQDWLDLPAEQRERVEIYPDALPVIVGRPLQQELAGSTVFKGKVINVGAKGAYWLEIEIETYDAGGQLVDIVKGYPDGLHLPAGQESSWQTITAYPYASYVTKVIWKTSL